MIHARPRAKRVLIEAYIPLVRLLGDGAPGPRRLLDEILGAEKKYADELPS